LLALQETELKSTVRELEKELFARGHELRHSEQHAFELSAQYHTHLETGQTALNEVCAVQHQIQRDYKQLEVYNEIAIAPWAIKQAKARILPTGAVEI
jgi:hypothetical protein